MGGAGVRGLTLGDPALVGRPASGVFSPLSIAWHTAFWAGDPNWTPPGDGMPVPQWDDASGNGRHATQATVLSQPVWNAATVAFNNRPTIQGDANDSLSTAAFTTLAQPNTLVVIGSTLQTSGNRAFVDGITGTARHFIYRTSGSAFNAFAGSEFSNGAADTAPHLFTACFNGASSYFENNGTRVTGNLGAQSLTGLTLFANNAASLQLVGHLAFVGLYSGVLPDADIANIEAWAASHYGLTIA